MADKGIHAHYTLKEINEQAKTIFKVADINSERLKKFYEIILHSKNVYLT